MNTAGIVLLCLSVITTLLFAFLFWLERTEVRGLRAALKVQRSEMRIVPAPDGSYYDTERVMGWKAGEIIKMSQTINDLEFECSTLRSDVETGCRTIEAQIKLINEQKSTINSLHGQFNAAIRSGRIKTGRKKR